MKKILYIEDNKELALMVETILKNQGFNVKLVHSGKECLRAKFAKLNDFDLILIDIMLPDMSGWDIYKKLKGKLKNTKFVFLSAIPISSERMIELKREGISDYILKPFEKTELINKINKLI